MIKHKLNILFVLLNLNDADFNWKKKKVIQNVWTEGEFNHNKTLFLITATGILEGKCTLKKCTFKKNRQVIFLCKMYNFIIIIGVNFPVIHIFCNSAWMKIGIAIHNWEQSSHIFPGDVTFEKYHSVQLIAVVSKAKDPNTCQKLKWKKERNVSDVSFTSNSQD